MRSCIKKVIQFGHLILPLLVCLSFQASFASLNPYQPYLGPPSKLPSMMRAPYFYGRRNCPSKVENVRNLQVYSRWGDEVQNCLVHVTPVEIKEKYRAYWFFQSGLFFVLDSYRTPGPPSETTGAHAYYFFPRRDRQEYWPSFKVTQKNNRKRLHVTAQNGYQFTFHPIQQKLIDIEKATFKEHQKIAPKVEGGVHFQNVDFPILDLGYQKGKLPHQNAPRKKSRLIGTNGETCQIANEALFDYRNPNHPKLKLELKTEQQRKEFLKEQEKCSKLSLHAE